MESREDRLGFLITILRSNMLGLNIFEIKEAIRVIDEFSIEMHGYDYSCEKLLDIVNGR